MAQSSKLDGCLEKVYHPDATPITVAEAKSEIKALMLEIISQLNGGDWSKPINSDELRQKIEVL